MPKGSDEDVDSTELPQEIAARVSGALGTDRFQAQPLTGVQSLNNDIHRITHLETGEVFALRIANERPTQYFGVSRENEALIAQVTGDSGIGPELVHFDARDGLMLTRWIENSRALTGAEFGQPETVEKLVKLLRRLHDLPLPATATPPDSFFKRIEALLASAESLSPDEAAPLLKHRDRLRLIAEEQAARTEQSQSLTHNDICPNNVLTDGHRLWLVDWEFSGLGDGLYDLATMASRFAGDRAGEMELLSLYGRSSAEDAELLRSYVWTEHFFEAAWGLVMASLAEPGLRADGDVFDFHEHAASMIGFLDR